MKKGQGWRAAKILFWLAVVGVGLWVAYAPKSTRRHAPPNLQVAVNPAPENPPAPPPAINQAPIGDEKAQTEASLPTPAPPPVSHAPSQPYDGTKPPTIALIIDDVGLDLKDSRRAVDLPSFVTLSYMPYATRLREQTAEAREQGHELMLHMPMEPLGHDDPGPGALLTGLPTSELRQRFDTALASFTGFDGVNNHMGSKFTADSAGMELVMGELQPRHLFFLDSRTSPQSVGEATARRLGVATLSRDVFLDDDMSLKAINHQLAQTERVARHKGYAIAIGHPHPATLQALEQWLPQAQASGFVFVPVRQLIAAQGE